MAWRADEWLLLDRPRHAHSICVCWVCPMAVSSGLAVGVRIPRSEDLCARRPQCSGARLPGRQLVGSVLMALAVARSFEPPRGRRARLRSRCQPEVGARSARCSPTRGAEPWPETLERRADRCPQTYGARHGQHSGCKLADGAALTERASARPLGTAIAATTQSAANAPAATANGERYLAARSVVRT